MAPMVDTNDLVDAQGVAEILHLAYRNTVSQYLERYPDMPRPLIDLGRGRPRLWSRTEMQRWADARARRKRR